jgi:hypothetical protein
MKPAPLLFFSMLAMLAACTSCKDDKPKPDNAPPPPPPSAGVAKPGACASGGGELTDSVSAPFFPKTVSSYCIDPQGEVKTYGEKGKLSMDEVCTTAFDGECEVYKRFGLKRVVALHYVDGAGKGGTVEVNLSQFADAGGAYGMYSSTRVVADRDPADKSMPKPLAAGGAGAIGTGRAYVWRGQYLAELQYNNEQESPEEVAKSSEAILVPLAKEIGSKLPGSTALPPAAAILPTENRIPNAISFHPKDVLGFKGVGPAAMGFYKDGDKRWRVLSIVKDDAEQAKDTFKTIKAKPGTLPIPNTGDEAAHVPVAPKVAFLFARKGNVIWGVGDEEYAVRENEKATVSKEDAVAKMKTLLATPAPAGSGSAAAPSPSSSAAPATSGSAPKK